MKDTYDYLCKLDKDIEAAIIKDKKKHAKDNRPYSLNAIINAQLRKYYGID